VSDVVTGAIIGATAVVVGGVVTGVIDLRARRQDRAHDAAERAADRQDAAATRKEERESADRSAWRERAALTLGRMLEFSTDVHPAGSTALIQNAEHAQAKLEKLEEKWNAVREPMGVLIIGLPTAAERDLAEDVLERFRRIFNGLTWVLADIARGRGPEARLVLDLERDWGEANQKLRALREAIHGVLTQHVTMTVDAVIQDSGEDPESPQTG
jgi:hypothetical protein